MDSPTDIPLPDQKLNADDASSNLDMAMGSSGSGVFTLDPYVPPTLGSSGTQPKENKSLGRQSAKSTGGSYPNLRVLNCSNLDSKYDYEMVFDKMKSFGLIQRIKMKLTSNQRAFDVYVTFARSEDANVAYNYFREEEPLFCSKYKVLNVSNLEDEEFDFIPISQAGSEVKKERVLPIPTWHVAFFKEGKENLIRAAESLQKKVGNIPRGNLKRYGKSVLIKAGNKTQAVLLCNFKASDEGNIQSVSPHRSFNTSCGIIYSRDLSDFTEEEILDKCPSSVFKVKKLKGGNGAILLTFTTHFIPDYVDVEHSRIKIKKYYRRPTQCFSCYEYGHGYQNCNKNKKCVNCSGYHELDNCTETSYCFLCEGNHSPKSRDCPRYKLEQEILEVADNEFISIGSAKRKVMGANKNSNNTYASAVKVLKRNTPRNNKPAPAENKASPRRSLPAPAENKASPQRSSLPVRSDPPSGENSNLGAAVHSGVKENILPSTSRTNSFDSLPDLCNPEKNQVSVEAKSISIETSSSIVTVLKKVQTEDMEFSVPSIKKRARPVSPKSSSSDVELKNSFSSLVESPAVKKQAISVNIASEKCISESVSDPSKECKLGRVESGNPLLETNSNPGKPKLKASKIPVDTSIPKPNSESSRRNRLSKKNFESSRDHISLSSQSKKDKTGKNFSSPHSLPSRESGTVRKSN